MSKIDVGNIEPLTLIYELREEIENNPNNSDGYSPVVNGTFNNPENPSQKTTPFELSTKKKVSKHKSPLQDRPNFLESILPKNEMHSGSQVLNEDDSEEYISLNTAVEEGNWALVLLIAGDLLAKGHACLSLIISILKKTPRERKMPK